MQVLRTSDGKGELKYFEHDKVELRYNNSGFVVTIYKPGRFRYYNTNSAYKCPMITVGQSDTKRWTFTELCDVPKHIKEAIDLLNKEGDGEFIPYDFKLSNETVDYVKILTPNNEAEPRLNKETLYIDENGIYYIYLGRGRLRLGGQQCDPWDRHGVYYCTIENPQNDLKMKGNILHFKGNILRKPKKIAGLKEVAAIRQYNCAVYVTQDGREHVIDFWD